MANKKFQFVIILFSTIYFLFSHRFADAAILYSGSAYQTVAQGQTFVVDWFVDTEGESLNSLSLKLKYSTDTLEAIRAEPGNSILSLWVASPSYSNESGEINLIGGTPAGFQGEVVPVLRTVFRAKKSGTAQITMDSTSRILRNDGSGSSAALAFRPLVFPVIAESIWQTGLNSPTHPDQNTWYKESRVEIDFEPLPGAELSYSFSSNLEIFPDDIADTPSAPVVYEGMPDGVYYFRLNARTTSKANWEEAGVFRVQIDQLPPEPFEPVLDSDQNIFEGKEFLSFSAVDKTSGISHYKVKVGQFGFFHETQSPYLIRHPLVGEKIILQAYDRAGNFREVRFAYTGILTPAVFFGILATLLCISVFILFRKRIRRKKI